SAAGVCNDRWNAAKAVSWEAVGAAIAAAERSGPQIEIERVVVFRDVGVAATQCKAAAHPLFEAKNSRVVLAGIPGTKAVDENSLRVVVNARGEVKIRLANTEEILDVLVVIVGAHDPIVGELALNAQSVAAGVGRGEAGIDGNREIAGLDD